jgi:hypothetical protein
MKRKLRIALGVLSLLAYPLTCLAGSTYYPYQSYDDYYKTHSVTPPPPPTPPQPPTQPVPEVKPLPPPDQPILLTEPPQFLFPPALGFGVAVGVPYDMFYTSKAFYLLKGGTWYRATSYHGPWTVTPLTRVPPELRKPGLAKIHQLRNAEFAKYWKSKGRYQGKMFRPGEELPPPTKTEKQQ